MSLIISTLETMIDQHWQLCVLAIVSNRQAFLAIININNHGWHYYQSFSTAIGHHSINKPHFLNQYEALTILNHHKPWIHHNQPSFNHWMIIANHPWWTFPRGSTLAHLPGALGAFLAPRHPTRAAAAAAARAREATKAEGPATGGVVKPWGMA